MFFSGTPLLFQWSLQKCWLISCQRIKPFPILDVQHKSFSLLLLGPQNALFWPQWPMIALRHLRSSPVFSQHGSQRLRATQHCFPCGWHLACYCTHSGHFQALLLCLQWNQTRLLWHPSPPRYLLLWHSQLLLFSFVGSIEMVTVLTVPISYGLILLAILRMRSAEGRRRVFSTCGSHLTRVSIFHGTVLFMYVRPSSNCASDHDMIVSIIYSIVIPMLNPIIYSLRNKDVKEAMKRVFAKKCFINKVYYHSKN